MRPVPIRTAGSDVAIDVQADSAEGPFEVDYPLLTTTPVYRYACAENHCDFPAIVAGTIVLEAAYDNAVSDDTIVAQ